jgi:inosine-uridine nucleoside N-ribohydrolase
MMDPTRVVLDCDTANEVDDQFAIAHALGVPERTVEVRGVISVHNTTAHGPGSRDMYQEEAERVVALCGSDVPCIPGAERPLESREEPVPSPGPEFLVEQARQTPLTIIATGPATDVASLFLDAAGAHDFSQLGREVDVVTDLDERRVLAGLMDALRGHPAEV